MAKVKGRRRFAFAADDPGIARARAEGRIVGAVSLRGPGAEVAGFATSIEAAPRKQAGREPSKTELRYAQEVLDPARRAGTVLRYVHQPKPPLVLAYRCTFSPDYRVECADGVTEYVDVKGSQVWEDATIKLKVAARLWPADRFVKAQWKGREWRRWVVPQLEPGR